MKWMGAFLLLAAGCGMGIFRTGILLRRAASLREAHRLILWIMRELRYTAAPLNELMERAAADPTFGEVVSLGKGCCFTDEDRSCWRHFTEELGKTDLQGQLTHSEYFAELFAEREKKAADAVKEKGRVLQILWTSGAAVLVLLLL